MKKFICLLTLSSCCLFANNYELIDKQSQFYLDNHEYVKAIKKYKQLLKQDPISEEYLYEIAYAYEMLGDFQKAKFWYKECVRFHDYYLAYTRLGIVYYRLKEYDNAKVVFNYLIDINEGYNYTAFYFLSLIYINERDYEKAHITICMLSKKNPDNPEILELQGRYYLAQRNYSKAYSVYNEMYLFPDFRDEAHQKLLGIREYSQPRVKFDGLVSSETEEDLALKIRTVKLDTWIGKTTIVYPLQDTFFPYGEFGYYTTTQFNLIQQLNNYAMEALFYTVGVEAKLPESTRIKAASTIRRGRDLPQTLFPFQSQTVWEPSLSFVHRNELFLLAMTAFKDNIIGRSTTANTSFFVNRKMADLTFEWNIPCNNSGIGVNGTLGNYVYQSTTRRGTFSSWLRMNIIKEPLDLIGEYRYTFGTFNFIDPDYYSYRARYEHNAIATAIFKLKESFRFLFHYKFGWVKQRDFVNIAENVDPTLPEVATLRKNIFFAHTVKVEPTFDFGKHFHASLVLQVYSDSNNYNAQLANAKLSWFF